LREKDGDGFGSDGERKWGQTVAWELVTAGVEQMRIIVDKTDCITFTITHMPNNSPSRGIYVSTYILPHWKMLFLDPILVCVCFLQNLSTKGTSYLNFVSQKNICRQKINELNVCIGPYIIMFMHVTENGNPQREDGCLLMM